MQGDNPFLTLLQNKPINTIIEPQDVLSFNVGDTLQAFLDGIAERGLLAAPIIGENGNVVGFVDVLDVASFFHKSRHDDFKMDDAAEIHLEEIIDMSQVNSYVPSLDINPLSFVLELFASGSHRVLILQDEGRVVLSQSDIVRVMHANQEDPAIKPMAELSLEDLGLGYKLVKTIHKDATVIEAITRISEFQISALAIVDDDGVLVGNFSASDLRGNFQELSTQFDHTIETFLQDNSPDSLNVHSMSPQRRLNQLLSTTVRWNRHRIWIVNEKMKPIGVVSLTDLCKLVQDYNYSKFAYHPFQPPLKLHVTILKARHLIKGDFFSSNPYVVVDLPDGDTTYRTQTIQKNLNPEWENERFDFIVDQKQAEDRLSFCVWHENRGKSDDLLGRFSVKMSWIINGFGTGNYVPTITGWYQLRNDKDQGQVQLTFTIEEIRD